MLNSKYRNYIIPVILSSIILVLLLPTLFFPITYVNDFVFFHDYDFFNVFFPSFALIWGTSFFPLSESILYVFELIFSPDSPTCIKTFSLILHILNVLLFMRFLKAWKPTPEEEEIKDENIIISALAWIFHPINIALIFWMPGIKMIIGTSFLLIALISCLEELKSPYRKIAIALCFFMASLSHPFLLLAPISLFLFFHPFKTIKNILNEYWLCFFSSVLAFLFFIILHLKEGLLVDQVWLTYSINQVFKIDDLLAHFFNLAIALRDLLSFQNYDVFYLASSFIDVAKGFLHLSTVFSLVLVYGVYKNWESASVRKGFTISIFFCLCYFILKPILYKADTLFIFTGIYSTSIYGNVTFLYPAAMGLCLMFRDGRLFNWFLKTFKIKDSAYVLLLFLIIFPFHLSKVSSANSLFLDKANNDHNNYLAKAALLFQASDREFHDSDVNFFYDQKKNKNVAHLLNLLESYVNLDFSKSFYLLTEAKKEGYYLNPYLDFVIYDAIGKKGLESIAIENIKDSYELLKEYPNTLENMLEDLNYDEHHEPIKNYLVAGMDLYEKEDFDRALNMFLIIKALDTPIFDKRKEEDYGHLIDPIETKAWILKSTLKINEKSEKKNEVKK